MNIKNFMPGMKAVSSLKNFKEASRRIEQAKRAGDYEKERELINEATTTWSRKLLRDWGASLRVKGSENIPDAGPAAIVMNHQGYADIVCACALIDQFQFGFIAKSELLKMPLYGKWMMDIRSVLIDRSNPREALKSLSEATELLKLGFSLVIFPEGTRSKSHEIGEFKKGSLKFATRAGVKLLPVVIDGTAEMYEIPGYIRGWDLKASILPPIETANMEKSDENLLHEKLEQLMKAEYAKMLAGTDANKYKRMI